MADVRIILKVMLKNEAGMVWTGFVWLKLTSAWLL
jgi:hypothetical protein